MLPTIHYTVYITSVAGITPSDVSLWVIVLLREQFFGKFVVGLSERLHSRAIERWEKQHDIVSSFLNSAFNDYTTLEVITAQFPMSGSKFKLRIYQDSSCIKRDEHVQGGGNVIVITLLVGE